MPIGSRPKKCQYTQFMPACTAPHSTPQRPKPIEAIVGRRLSCPARDGFTWPARDGFTWPVRDGLQWALGILLAIASNGEHVLSTCSTNLHT